MRIRGTSTAIVAIAWCALLNAAAPPASAQEATLSVADTIIRYSEVWDSRNVERIVNLQTVDSTFRLAIDGMASTQGRTSVRDAFAKILADNPAYRSTVPSVKVGPNFTVIECDIHMAPPRPFVFGSTRHVTTGIPYALPTIDVIEFKNGLVSDRATYLDSSVGAANSCSAERPASPQ